MENIVFVDSEINIKDKKIDDLGAYKLDKTNFHSNDIRGFKNFVSDCGYVCGHNIFNHDLKYISSVFSTDVVFIDTLPISPLLFPDKPYHKLLKDDKLKSDAVNNPLNDSMKASELFLDEVNQFRTIPNKLKFIYCSLLYKFPQFQGFFKYIGFEPYNLNKDIILNEFKGYICDNADIDMLINEYPIELAYALAIIKKYKTESRTPGWVLKTYPRIGNVFHFLCGKPCYNCDYCNKKLNIHLGLKKYFGYDNFRKYDNEPLQENAVKAAINGESLLAIFPTGGGKSLTFQLPALMCGDVEQGLTVVISPLQSLMKDQVDNLNEKEIPTAASINGLMDPIERKDVIRRVKEGQISLLYLAPEQLRSATIENLLLSRNVSRFVIDEAHCFSAWGQDFRVDYLYIAKFIKNLQKKKGIETSIPISCFTATAKQKVVSDIKDYFLQNLGLELKLFTTQADRENLHYNVFFEETDNDKYNQLRSLIESHNCPTIVYVSRTKRCETISERLNNDGISAKPFYGQMDKELKIENQELFMQNSIQVMVATSAFGLGVDKKDIGLVIHYDISDSLENYIQEAGRAGRDFSMKADCYVLFNNDDLDKHFTLLNQTKLSIGEIQQVWKAIKELTKKSTTIYASPLELARKAGWDDTRKNEMETRVRTAISALEQSGYVERGKNSPRIYATSINVKNMQEAVEIIDNTNLLTETQKLLSKRIIKSLITLRSVARPGNEENPESRVDYLADNLGADKKDIISVINIMRQLNILKDDNDIIAYIFDGDENKSISILKKNIEIEKKMIDYLMDEDLPYDKKRLNNYILDKGIKCSPKYINNILYFWSIKGYIKRVKDQIKNITKIVFTCDADLLRKKIQKRHDIAKFIITTLYNKNNKAIEGKDTNKVNFSIVGMFNEYNDRICLIKEDITLNDIENSLLYLSKIDAMKIDGGFLVSYNALQIKRKELDNKILYKKDDYKQLDEYYKLKIQQIHIVGKYANMMVQDYKKAIIFVHDYFYMEYKRFIRKYFHGKEIEISRNITPEKFRKIFGSLSNTQSLILNDVDSKNIVVAAGPGSGKTRVLVNQMAALITLNEVKHEQLLMVTFSRAAATEFKKRLIELAGNAASYVEIKTFHSYAFDILGQIGNVEDSKNVVQRAADAILNNEVETNRVTKSVILIDEAQDMEESEYKLINAIASLNDEIKIVAVGDDDQNIYEFRGSDSRYLKSFLNYNQSKLYEMCENYRSDKNIVEFSNDFILSLHNRMKNKKCISMTNGFGNVDIIKYKTNNLEKPLIEDLIKNNDKGSVAVLTNTNEEAFKIVGMLNKNGKKAKLIQSLEGFNLFDLVEIRYFITEIDKLINNSPKISDKYWDDCIQKLKSIYDTSSCLNICLKILNDFKKINMNKYRTDLEEFIRESKLEDFYDVDDNSVTVSTIHKAKGREFDNVYLLLNNISLQDSANIRKIYVAITRAKHKLSVHYNNDILDKFKDKSYLVFKENYKDYDKPDKIILNLTHKDVYLDMFKYCNLYINKIRCGQELSIDDNYRIIINMNNKNKILSKLSKNCIAKIEELKKEFYISRVKVNFMVYWKNKDNDNELVIALPEIELCKNEIV